MVGRVLGSMLLGAVLLAPAAHARAGFVPVKGAVTADAAVNVTYHGGRVLVHGDVAYAVFWDPPTLQDGSPTYMGPLYEGLIERYFTDVSGSGLYENTTQYFKQRDHRRRFIANTSSFAGAWEDTSPYPPSGCDDAATPGNCLALDQMVAEVRKAMQVNGWTNELGHVFYLFTSFGEGSCAYGGCAFTTYCAFHDYTVHRGADAIIWADMPYGATAPADCGADFVPNDYDADTTVNVLSHEQMEAVTDPFGSAWYTSVSFSEIADKCAWTYGPHPYAGGTANQLWNGHPYNVQREWSNARHACVQQGP